MTATHAVRNPARPDRDTLQWLERHRLRLPARPDLEAVAAEVAEAIDYLFTPSPCGHKHPQCVDCPWSRFAAKSQWTTAKVRSLFGCRLVTEPADACLSGPPFYCQQLSDGTLGYFQRRTDDCVQAAVATVLGVNPWTVPDSRLIERSIAGESVATIVASATATLDAWLADRGLAARVGAPEEHGHGKWIGVVNANGPAFRSHCLVMSEDAVLFNPAWQLPDNGTPRLSAARPAAIAMTQDNYKYVDYSISIEGKI